MTDTDTAAAIERVRGWHTCRTEPADGMPRACAVVDGCDEDLHLRTDDIAALLREYDETRDAYLIGRAAAVSVARAKTDRDRARDFAVRVEHQNAELIAALRAIQSDLNRPGHSTSLKQANARERITNTLADLGTDPDHGGVARHRAPRANCPVPGCVDRQDDGDDQ